MFEKLGTCVLLLWMIVIGVEAKPGPSDTGAIIEPGAIDIQPTSSLESVDAAGMLSTLCSAKGTALLQQTPLVEGLAYRMAISDQDKLDLCNPGTPLHQNLVKLLQLVLKEVHSGGSYYGSPPHLYTIPGAGVVVDIICSPIANTILGLIPGMPGIVPGAVKTLCSLRRLIPGKRRRRWRRRPKRQHYYDGIPGTPGKIDCSWEGPIIEGLQASFDPDPMLASLIGIIKSVCAAGPSTPLLPFLDCSWAGTISGLIPPMAGTVKRMCPEGTYYGVTTITPGTPGKIDCSWEETIIGGLQTTFDPDPMLASLIGIIKTVCAAGPSTPLLDCSWAGIISGMIPNLAGTVKRMCPEGTYFEAGKPAARGGGTKI